MVCNVGRRASSGTLKSARPYRCHVFEYRFGLPGNFYHQFPCPPPHKANWCIGQLGTCLSRGPEAIWFNRAAVCGNIVVPIQKPYAKELGLLYDALKIITADNCQFWADFDPGKDFPGDGELCMAPLPRAIPFGQGAAVPQSFDELLNSVESAIAKPTILNGEPAPGLADALRALKKNEFYSFFGKSKKYGADRKSSIKTSRN